MTMLLSVCTQNYVLSTTDLRITQSTDRGPLIIDEKFNKHILYTSESYMCDITYTGVAQWERQGKIVRMYNTIADSASVCARDNAKIAELLVALSVCIRKTLVGLNPSRSNGLELHIVGFHREFPHPFMACVSSMSSKKPWTLSDDCEWQWTIGGLSVSLAFREGADLMIGGIGSAITEAERQRLLKAASDGADAFNISNLCRKYITVASRRDSRIGERSASLVIPIEGWIDTNLWDEKASGVLGFMPTWIFANGSIWAPSEVPIELKTSTKGHFPKDSLFFKSIAYSTLKRSQTRRLFKRKKGKKIPGLFGIIGLTLYGKIIEGYDSLGLEF